MYRFVTFSAAALLCAATVSAVSAPARAMSLQEAVSIATSTNPEIKQAEQNREATEFELRQARGLYMPTVDLEASVGARRLDNPTRGRLGTDGDTLNPADVGLTVRQTLFDGGDRRSQVREQAARVDSASFQVLERSEGIALAVVQEYLEFLLQSQIVREARENANFHQQILGDISEGIRGGALTDADRLQGEERLLAAQAALVEAEEELSAARIRFLRLVGQPIENPRLPGSITGALPRTLPEAVELARRNNPNILRAGAEVDAADARVDGARSSYLPSVALEGRGRVGEDIDGNEGDTTDYEVKVVARWNLYNGGRDTARTQEQIRRASQQRLALHQVHREVEENVMIAWDLRSKRSQFYRTVARQVDANAALISSYREQFRVGQRSLLDVLDAQNTRFNVSVLAQTARYATIFADYRILAATGTLLDTLSVGAPAQGEAYARDEFNVPSETDRVYYVTPSRQSSTVPLDLFAPARQE